MADVHSFSTLAIAEHHLESSINEGLVPQLANVSRRTDTMR